MSDIFFKGVWRMDWGFGNPNKTAALIAILMVAVWVFAYIRRWGFWVALVAFAALGITLVHTISRGGLIALAAGCVPLIVFAPRPWPRGRLVSVIGVFWVLVGASVYLKASERYAHGIVREDRSITNRLLIWSHTPAMMVNAPGGWGFGNAAKAYMQWYQPLDRNEVNSTLVNSHLTWMVEMGWPARFVYVLGWFLVLWLCWPSRSCRWLAVPFGVWTGFFVAAIFNPVADPFVIWIVPLILLLAVLVYRLKTKDWPSRTSSLIPLSATILVVVSFAIIGLRSQKIHGTPSSVVLGGKQPTAWILYEQTTMGTQYGKSLRRIFGSNSDVSVGVALIPSAAEGADVIVLGGSIPNDQISSIKKIVANASRVVLLSPKFFPQEIGIDPSNGGKAFAIFGDFTQSPSTSAWRSVGKTLQLPGVGDFIPNWPQLVLDELKYGKK